MSHCHMIGMNTKHDILISDKRKKKKHYLKDRESYQLDNRTVCVEYRWNIDGWDKKRSVVVILLLIKILRPVMNRTRKTKPPKLRSPRIERRQAKIFQNGFHGESELDSWLLPDRWNARIWCWFRCNWQRCTLLAIAGIWWFFFRSQVFFPPSSYSVLFDYFIRWTFQSSIVYLFHVFGHTDEGEYAIFRGILGFLWGSYLSLIFRFLKVSILLVFVSISCND